MKRRLLSLLLLTALLTGAVSGAASMAEAPAPASETVTMEAVVEDLLSPLIEQQASASRATRAAVTGYVPRTSSSKLIAFIEAREGFVQNPVWDVSQWTIGFGSHCNPGDYPNGITREEAEQLLIRYLTDEYEPVVNRIAQMHNLKLSQELYDGLIDFTYALGSSWASGSRLYTALRNGDLGSWEFINAVGTWCHVSNVADHGTATRRCLELEIMLNGNYYNSGKNNNLQYTYLLFDANGGTTGAVNAGGQKTNLFYFTGKPYGALLTATRPGYIFDGWYTAATGGTRITTSTIATVNTGSSYYAGRTVYAHWRQGGTQPQPDPATGFYDIKTSDWFYDDVKTAVERGLFNGTDTAHFSPDQSMTRAMAVTVLYRMAKDSGLYVMPFLDVPAGSYYRDAVAWAAANGIVTGTSSTRFSPDERITREQLVTILYRYTTEYKKNPEGSVSIPTTYRDLHTLSAYAADAMAWAITHHVINGTTSTTLSPQQHATRAQTATILVRYQTSHS